MAHRRRLEGKVIRAVPGLCPLEHDTLRVEGLTGHYRQSIISLQIQTVLIDLRDTLHRDRALAHHDAHVQILLDILVDRTHTDLFRQPLNQILVKQVDIKHARIAVQRTDSLHIIKLRSDRESGPLCDMVVGCQLRKTDQLRGRLQVVPPGALTERFNPGNQKRRGLRPGINDPDASSVHRLHIPFLGKHGNRAANRIAGAAEPDDQLILRRHQRLVRQPFRFDIRLQFPVNRFEF